MSRPLTIVDREKVIAYMHAHLGQGEQPKGSNNTEFGRWYGINPAQWCAMSMSAAFYHTIGFSPFPASTSKGFAACVSGASWFRRQGKWAPASVIPKRGWLIFFTWPGDKIEHHVGLVLSANAVRNVQTIEGNTSDKVELHNRRASIAGYGIIDYAPAPTVNLVRAPNGTPVLKRGDRTTRVAELQVALNFGTGSRLAGIGLFGPATERALRNLQKIAKLQVDGVYGPQSQLVLQVACDREAAKRG